MEFDLIFQWIFGCSLMLYLCCIEINASYFFQSGITSFIKIWNTYIKMFIQLFYDFLKSKLSSRTQKSVQLFSLNNFSSLDFAIKCCYSWGPRTAKHCLIFCCLADTWKVFQSMSNAITVYLIQFNFHYCQEQMR